MSRLLLRVSIALSVLCITTVLAQPSGASSDHHRRGTLPDNFHPECASDPNSADCLAAKAHSNLHGNAGLDPATEREVNEFATIIHTFESLINEWACSMSWFGLYSVPNEKDSFDTLYKILASALKAKGQLYAAAIVKHFVKNINGDEMKPYTCKGLKFRDASKWKYPAEVLIHLKESLSKWMLSHEADPAEVVDFVISNGRDIYSRWLLGRLMTINKDAPNVEEPVSIASVMPVINVLEGEKLEEVRCSAGAQFKFMFSNASNNAAIMAKADKYLDECTTAGRLHKKPQIFARSLLGAGREREARELLDLAVQRGQLCNAKQRPSSYHRKDLTATPVWGLEAFPKEVRQALADVQDPIYEAVKANRFEFSNDLLTFSLFVADGKWERTLLYGPQGLNQTKCKRWGEKICGALQRLADVVTEANDAYSFACNETLVMNLWRVQPGAHTGFSLGPTNINLQAVMPIVAKNTALVLQVGDEVVKARQGDIVIVDDTFENKLTLVDEDAEEEGTELARFTDARGNKVLDPDFKIEKGSVIFQVQLCHPDLHDKAMEVPVKKCAHLIPKVEIGPASGASGGAATSGDFMNPGSDEL